MKSLKHILPLILLITALSYQPVAAQGGVFMVWQDYVAGKVSYPIECNKSSEKIKLHTFDAKSYIDIIQGSKKYTLSKDSIYGYRDCKGKDFRIVKDYCHTYQIAENKSIVIYITEIVEVKGKYCRIVPKFCFSKGPDGGVLPLTFDNLKLEFPGNRTFHQLLDTQFNSEYNISDYDKEHKMYKVNYLLDESLNKH